MLDMRAVPVNGKDGWHGTIDLERTQTSNSRYVRLDDGREIMVPADLMQRQPDGSFYLPLSLAELELEGTATRRKSLDTTILPVVEEQLDVQKVAVTTGVVHVSKIVHERQELVDEPLLHEDITVERKPINRVIEETPQIRYEGDTMIVPVLEEVLVVEKRLMLKEELHITRRKNTVHQPQEATLRSEEVIVERRKPDDAAEGVDRSADNTDKQSGIDFAQQV